MTWGNMKLKVVPNYLNVSCWVTICFLLYPFYFSSFSFQRHFVILNSRTMNRFTPQISPLSLPPSQGIPFLIESLSLAKKAILQPKTRAVSCSQCLWNISLYLIFLSSNLKMFFKVECTKPDYMNSPFMCLFTGVGKSCLLLQFTDKRFQPVHDLTIGKVLFFFYLVVFLYN